MEKEAVMTRERSAIRKLNVNHGNVYGQGEFETLVRYERARSDRSGSVFSVAVFTAKNGEKYDFESYLLRMAKLARSIDCLAANEDGRVSVLLPDTKRDGAECFVDKVLGCRGLPGEEAMAYDIYTYPDHWLDKEENGSPRSEREESADAVKNGIESLFVKRMPAWKRALDIAGSGAILLLTLPFTLLLALYIKIVSPGPVFFKQIRVGYKGVPFTFYKFRTMKHGNNQGFHGNHAQNFIKAGEVPMAKLDGADPRIIPGGKLIRKLCIDELPQFWNVLRGEMSMVGPRPCIPYEAKVYLRWHTHRFDTVPGLTGLWQVSGKNRLTFNQMIRLDIAYSRNMSLLQDLVIILRTPVAILEMVAEGISEKFKRPETSPRPSVRRLRPSPRETCRDLAAAIPELEH